MGAAGVSGRASGVWEFASSLIAEVPGVRVCRSPAAVGLSARVHTCSAKGLCRYPRMWTKVPRCASRRIFFLPEFEKMPARWAPACIGAPAVYGFLPPVSLKMLLRSSMTHVRTVRAPG